MHDALDVLQHHNRVVHYDADGQHHAKQGQRVDRVTEQVETGKRADQRHWHCDSRDQGGAQVLQKQEHHEKHQHHRLGERNQYLADRDFDKAGGVIGRRVGEAGRKPFRQGAHVLVHVGRHRQRIRTGLQEDADQRRLLAVDAADKVIVLAAQLNARHIAQAHRAAIRVGAHDDLFKLARLRHAPACGDGVDQFLPFSRGTAGLAYGGRLPDLARSELGVLLVDRTREVGSGEFELCQPVRLDPHPHRVILRAENLHVGGARHTLQAIEHIERDVVRDEQTVVAVIGRIKRQHLQERRRPLLHRHALAAHLGRQARLSLLDTVVDVERGLVDVGADIKRHLNLHHALRGRGRTHVEHFLDAVDLVFQRRSDSLLQHLGRRAGVDRLHRHHRRGDLRVL